MKRGTKDDERTFSFWGSLISCLNMYDKGLSSCVVPHFPLKIFDGACFNYLGVLYSNPAQIKWAYKPIIKLRRFGKNHSSIFSIATFKLSSLFSCSFVSGAFDFSENFSRTPWNWPEIWIPRKFTALTKLQLKSIAWLYKAPNELFNRIALYKLSQTHKTKAKLLQKAATTEGCIFGLLLKTVDYFPLKRLVVPDKIWFNVFFLSRQCFSILEK